MILALLDEVVTVKRRNTVASASRDSFNNPVYGAPTSGAGWYTAYTNMPIRFAFSKKDVEFAPTGERIKPNGVAYSTIDYTIFHEDRFITSNGVEYVVTGVSKGYLTGNVLDHMEYTVELP